MAISKVITLTCPICRDDDDGTNMVVTKCGHVFHSQCMKNWEEAQGQRGTSRKCPYCGVQYHSGYYDDYSSSSSKMIRLHSLTPRQVIIIEEGQPSPEEEHKTVRANLDAAKVLLNKETNKVRQLEIDLTKCRHAQADLEATITQLKTESKAQTHKISTILGELKIEKQNRQKALATYLGEKERLQKRIDDGSSYIDRLKAERLEINKNLHALRVDNTNVRGLSDRQGHIIKQLNVQLAAVSREKNALAAKINAMRREKSLIIDGFNFHSNYNVLNDLNGGFQRLETEYLALKELFAQKLRETANAQSQKDPSIDDILINPLLTQPIESASFSWENRDVENPDSTKPFPSIPLDVELGKGKSGKRKGKSRSAWDNSTKKDWGNQSNPENLSIKPDSSVKSKNKKWVRNQVSIMTKSDDNSMKKQDPTIVASNQETESESSKDKGKVDQVTIEPQVKNPIMTTSDNNLVNDNSMKEQDPTIVASNQKTESESSKDKGKIDQVAVEPQVKNPIMTTSDNNLANDNSMKEQDPTIVASNRKTESESSKDKGKIDQVAVEPQVDPIPDKSSEDKSLHQDMEVSEESEIFLGLFH